MVSTFACRTVLFRHCIIHRSSWVIVKHPYRVHSSIQTAIERRISSGCLPPPFFLFMRIRHEWRIWQPAVVSTDGLSRSILFSLFNWFVLLLLLFFYWESLFSLSDHASSCQTLPYHWFHALGLLHLNDCLTFCTPIMSVLVVERRDTFCKLHISHSASSVGHLDKCSMESVTLTMTTSAKRL